VQEAFRDMLYEVDFLLAPTRQTTASKVTDPLDNPAPASSVAPKSRGLSGLIPAGNLAGLPALSLPCGFANGLPIAISIVGRPFFENHLLGVGKAFQSVTDWHRKRPIVAA
jgi:aspartyl-tRNA(Asn)/glutamyl-tRNA(Gln) amidotransferase subunit A